MKRRSILIISLAVCWLVSDVCAARQPLFPRLRPRVAAAQPAVQNDAGLFDRFTDFTDAIRGYRQGTMTGPAVADAMAKPRFGRQPNPQRICMAIEIANIIGPIVMSMQNPPGTWTPIPLPAFCTAPAPAPTGPRAPGVLTPVPDPVGPRLSNAELNRVANAVVNGMF